MKDFEKYASGGYFVARGAILQPLVQRLAEAYYRDIKITSEPLLGQSSRPETHQSGESGFDPVLQAMVQRAEQAYCASADL